MSDVVDRLRRLGDEILSCSHPLLSLASGMHFRHVLLTSPEDSLSEQFLTIRRGTQNFNPDQLAIEQSLAIEVDGVVEEILALAEREGQQLPYTNSDALWRRVAFAALVFAEEDAKQSEAEGKEGGMLNEMVLKVAHMVSVPGGLRLLESFVINHGFE